MKTEGKLARFVMIVTFIFSGPRSTSQIAITVISPSRATVTAGESVFLVCTFQRPGNCSWTLNAGTLPISNRYNYAHFGDDIQKSNCLMEILNVKEEDAGNWTCTIPANPNARGILSKSTYIHVKGNYRDPKSSVENAEISEVELVRSPASANVTAGHSVILACEFSHSVNCSWKRNSVFVEIVNRYEYIDDRNGIQTRNCWIEIKMVEEQDDGQWRCGFYTYDDDIAILSNPANLSVEEISSTQLNHPVTPKDDVNEPMLAVIIILTVVLMIIIAVGITNILRRRARRREKRKEAKLRQKKHENAQRERATYKLEALGLVMAEDE